MRDKDIIALTLVYECPRSKQVTVMIDCNCGQQHSIILFDGYNLGEY